MYTTARHLFISCYRHIQSTNSHLIPIIYFNTALPIAASFFIRSLYLRFSNKIFLCISLVPYACHMFGSSSPPHLHSPNNTDSGAANAKILYTKFRPTSKRFNFFLSSSFLSLWRKRDLLQHQ